MNESSLFFSLFQRIFFFFRESSGTFFFSFSTKILLSIVLVLAVPQVGWGLVEIDVVEGQRKRIPIAIPDFVDSSGGTIGKRIAEVIRDDLERSGLFAVIAQNESVPDTHVHEAPEFEIWKNLGTQILLVGQLVSVSGEDLEVQFRVWDVLSGKEIEGQSLVAGFENWRRLAHIAADVIYERLTGERGYFDTQIAFVAESGSKESRVKRLAIMDQDGANLQYLTDGSDLVLTPRFSPDGQSLIYVSFMPGEHARIVLKDLQTGKQHFLGDFPGMTFAPQFVPDGSGIVMSMQSGGNANLYFFDLRTQTVERLTWGDSLDTSPSFSPDGRFLVFESDRSGSQQIYLMDREGTNQKQISSGTGSYSTPVWSPKGNWIAFTKQEKGKFQIGVLRPKGGGERILAEGFHMEGPAWAPNGRLLMFFRDVRGSRGGPQIWFVDITGQNERRLPVSGFASDPAWSPFPNNKERTFFSEE